MNPIRSLPTRLWYGWKSKRDTLATAKPAKTFGAKGHNLLRLHEYQHRVIVEIFKVSIIGFSAFIFVLLAFSLYSVFDPFAPGWVSGLLGFFSALLILGLYRTMREFRTYRRNYNEIATRLRAKVAEQSRSAEKTGGKGENRLLAALKPKEHDGWDHKPCTNCQKSIELLANVCQHCGQEQEALLVN